MTDSHYYLFAFLSDNDGIEVDATKYPVGFTPLVPELGSFLHFRDKENRLVHGKLDAVSFGFKPTYTLVALHLKDTQLTPDLPAELKDAI